MAYRGLPLRQDAWEIEPGGELSTEFGSLRLIIHQSADCARFRVVLSAGAHGSPELMLASGTEANLNAAIQAAIKAAVRIEKLLAERLRIAKSTERSNATLVGA